VAVLYAALLYCVLQPAPQATLVTFHLMPLWAQVILLSICLCDLDSAQPPHSKRGSNLSALLVAVNLPDTSDYQAPLHLL
jgi:hypothetical protein